MDGKGWDGTGTRCGKGGERLCYHGFDDGLRHGYPPSFTYPLAALCGWGELARVLFFSFPALVLVLSSPSLLSYLFILVYFIVPPFFRRAEFCEDTSCRCLFRVVCSAF